MTDTPTEPNELEPIDQPDTEDLEPLEELPTHHPTTSTVIGYAGRTSTTITHCHCGNPWPCPNLEEETNP